MHRKLNFFLNALGIQTQFHLHKASQLNNPTRPVARAAADFSDADLFAYQDCFDARAMTVLWKKSGRRQEFGAVKLAYIYQSSQNLVDYERTWGPSKISNIFKFYQQMAEISALIEYARGVI